MRGAPPPLTNFERGKTLLGHVKPLAVTVGSQEDVIVRAGVDCLGKCGIQVDGGCAPDPNFSSADNWLSDTYLEKRMYPDAISELDKTKPYKEQRIS